MDIILWLGVYAILAIFAIYLLFPIVFGLLMIIETLFGDVIEKWTTKR